MKKRENVIPKSELSDEEEQEEKAEETNSENDKIKANNLKSEACHSEELKSNKKPKQTLQNQIEIIESQKKKRKFSEIDQNHVDAKDTATSSTVAKSSEENDNKETKKSDKNEDIDTISEEKSEQQCSKFFFLHSRIISKIKPMQPLNKWNCSKRCMKTIQIHPFTDSQKKN